MSKEKWRFAALVLIAVNIVFLLAAGLALATFHYNLRAVANGAPVCLANFREYDSIAAALMIGRLDLVSFLLTAGGLLFAVFAFVGFWAVRRDVIDQAETIATDVAQRVAQKYYSEENEKRTKKSDKSTKKGHKETKQSSAPELDSVSVARAERETEEDNDKSQ